MTLELGCGKAEVTLELARRYPGRNFIGVDIKGDRLWRPAQTARDENLTNVAFLRTNLTRLADFFEPASVGEIWITFPDPFPKKRQAKHRMTGPVFLDMYKLLLQSGSTIRFKTDNRPLCLWTLETLVARNDTKLLELSFDLHKSNLSDDYKIETTYEKLFGAEGYPTNYVSWSFTLS